MKMLRLKYKNKELKEGSILLSEPLLPDENFSRTVVLICEHNDKGTVGLVLNRITISKLSDVVDGFDSVDLPLYNGGPVERDVLQFIHTIGPEVPETTCIGEGIYWGGELDYIRDLAKKGTLKASQICFFIGYAGWGKYQLYNEIAEKSWLVSDLDPVPMLTVKSDEMWEYCVRNLGEAFRIWLNCPVNPILN